MIIQDFARKIIVQKDDIVSWNDDNGILHVSIEQFLLDNFAIISTSYLKFL